MTKEDKQIIDRAVKEEWRIGDRTRLKRLLEKNLKLYRENIELEDKIFFLFNKIALQEQQIEEMKRCEICKHFRWNCCSYEISITKDCIQNKMKHFELKEIEK